MLVKFQRLIRNCYYSLFSTFRKNKYFEVFHLMYQNNKTIWPSVRSINISPPKYLIFDFCHPSLAFYRGHELAIVTFNLVSCYWMPGANTAAQGHVKEGDYLMKLILPMSFKNITISLRKEKGIFQLIDQNENKTDTIIKGIYLPYKKIQPELIFLLNQWFDFCLEKILINNNIQNVNEIRKIALKCLEFNDGIAEKAKKIIQYLS